RGILPYCRVLLVSHCLWCVFTVCLFLWENETARILQGDFSGAVARFLYQFQCGNIAGYYGLCRKQSPCSERCGELCCADRRYYKYGWNLSISSCCSSFYSTGYGI